ncbi:MAG: hypothetical protein U0169_04830 [Polyangiaceae bacterium]
MPRKQPTVGRELGGAHVPRGVGAAIGPRDPRPGSGGGECRFPLDPGPSNTGAGAEVDVPAASIGRTATAYDAPSWFVDATRKDVPLHRAETSSAAEVDVGSTTTGAASSTVPSRPTRTVTSFGVAPAAPSEDDHTTRQFVPSKPTAGRSVGDVVLPGSGMPNGSWTTPSFRTRVA